MWVHLLSLPALEIGFRFGVQKLQDFVPSAD